MNALTRRGLLSAGPGDIEDASDLTWPTASWSSACWYCDPYSYPKTFEGGPPVVCERHRERQGPALRFGLPPAWLASWRRGTWA